MGSWRDGRTNGLSRGPISSRHYRAEIDKWPNWGSDDETNRLAGGGGGRDGGMTGQVEEGL